jgi:predicted acylesterase/phospholipase RssA
MNRINNERPVLLLVGGYGRADGALSREKIDEANRIAYELGRALISRDIDLATGGRFDMSTYFIAGAKDASDKRNLNLRDRVASYYAEGFPPVTDANLVRWFKIDDLDTFWFQILGKVDALAAISGRDNTFNAINFAKQMDITVYPIGTIEGTASDAQQRLAEPELQFLGDHSLTAKQMADSIADSVQSRFQIIHRNPQFRRSQSTGSDTDGQVIGMALSGGGFRATLFHLGVIRLLLEARKLKNVRHFSAVSGGSILAAHLILNWERYCSAGTFDAAAKELISFVSRGIRRSILIRRGIAAATLIPLLSGHNPWTLSNLLVSHYGRLLQGARLDRLRGDNRPHVTFNCASLTNGSAFGFDNTDFFWYENGEEKPIDTPETPIAFAVAASSAFPPLFPPIMVSNKTLSCDRAAFPNAQYLTDGGVFDNLGVDRLLWRQRRNKEFDLLLISDAEGNFDHTFETDYAWPINRNVRASDILMTRVSYMQLGNVRTSNVPFSHIKIKGEIENTSNDLSLLLSGCQRLLCNVRTDLDGFSETEITSLIAHGYSKARYQLIKDGILPEGTPKFTWDPLGNWATVRNDPKTLTKLQASSARRL